MTYGVWTNSSSNHTFNNTNLPFDQLSIRFWFAFSTIISISGSSLFILLLVASFYEKKLQKGANLLIIHIMLIQLLLCALLFPILNTTSYLLLKGHRINFNCRLFLLAQVGAMNTENWASLLLAINRYVAIAMPHFYKAWVSKKVLISMIVIPWVIGIGDTLSVYLGFGANFMVVPPFNFCIIRGTDGFIGTIWVVIGAYLPLGLMGILYSAIFIRLAIVRRFNLESRIEQDVVASVISANGISRRSKRARQISLAQMLIVSYVWYGACFLPAPVILASFPNLNRRFFMLPLWTAKTLMLSGYAASPVSFIIILKDSNQF
jgi:hypothetical protein